MIDEFIPAAHLKKRYQVHGYFYDVHLEAQHLSCRSVLEIVRNDRAPVGPESLPDAVVIMMNPGSSKPLSGKSATIAHGRLLKFPGSLEEAKPDTTQYQVMRVMHYQDWGHVRVLNLSDLREAKSPIFAKKYLSLESEYGYGEHSIFSPARGDELATALKRKKGAPIMCAWGTSEKLASLIAQCMKAIRKHGPIVGLKKAGAPDRYFHPLPNLQVDKVAWVANIVALLASAQ